MSPRTASPSRVWIAVLIAALGFLVWINARRIERIERVTAIAQAAPQIAEASPTGYAGGTRELIVPERLSSSQEWIAITQQAIAHSAWRVREFDRENAPFGREVHATAPYRWWLGLVARTHRMLTGSPIGLSVERAAIYADPLLHALWLVGAVLLTARIAGAFGAGVVALGGVTVFPFAAGFLPGVPGEHALALVFATTSVLLILAGFRALEQSEVPAAAVTERRSSRNKVASPPTPAAPSGRRWFIAAGVVGGLGVWNNVPAQVPVLMGITVGAVVAAWITRRAARDNPTTTPQPAPWRVWAAAGAATIAAGWLIEFFPGHMASWELRSVHPLYALAWLGGGEILARLGHALRRNELPRTPRDISLTLLALLAVASVPVAAYLASNPAILAVDALSFRLSKQIGAEILPNFSSWIAADGFSLKTLTVLLPLVALGASIGLMARGSTGLTERRMLCMVVAPALVATGLAFFQLRWWQVAGGCSLLALATCAAPALRASTPRAWRFAWLVIAVAVVALGGYRLLPGIGIPDEKELSVPEAEAVVGRHLAQWLARRSTVDGGAVVLAPPVVTTTLNHHGGLRGLASLSWENKDGLAAAIRMVISTSRDETHALVERRELNYIVLPTWDPFYEPFVRSASVQVGSLFMPSLQRWIVPPWLRPLPYEMPKLPGFEKQSVVVFEVVAEQDEPLAVSRLTEYFIEMAQPENAQIAAQALREFPADFGALIARAQLESALGQTEELSVTTEAILKRLTTGGDRSLPWDRRVSLATVLARAKRYDQAREQAKRCVAEIDEARLRDLTPYTLYHFLGLCKGFGLPIADPAMRAIALDLLPAELRSHL